MESEVAKLTVAENRLRDAIRTIVKRRASPGRPLSWRLMFEIEDEAIAMLQHDKEIDLHYLDLMASPSAQRCPQSDDAGRTHLYAMHTALWMIQEAYLQEMRTG